MYKRFLFGLFLILFISSAFAMLPQGSVKLLAVTQDGKGTDANLIITTTRGTGNVWSSIGSLVGTSTQNTEKTAVQLLNKYIKDANKYNYYFNIKSTASTVDGPSAGLPTALLLIYMSKNKKLPNYVSGTGTILSSGNIGKVGGILAKTKYAASTGTKIFFVPKDELNVVVKDNNEVKQVNLSTYAYKKYGIKVVGVSTIDEALTYNLADINNIDINDQNQVEKPIYIPPETKAITDLNAFQSYISDYQDKVNSNITLVQRNLKNANLKDNDLLTELYSTLTDAKITFNEGRSAYEKNYLYSAANNFFLANISLNLINDILTNSDILDNSQTLNNMVNKLQKAENIDYKNIPCNNYEWFIASQERYLWAENKINYVITTLGTDKITNIERLQAYEEAKEWLDIANLFYNYAKAGNCYLNQEPYKQSANQVLGEINKANAIVTKYKLTDADKWVTGAKDANTKGWYFASVFESATALGVINSYLELKDANIEDIKQKVNDLITKVKNEQKTGYIWANLYLQHAEYLQSQGQFYESKSEPQDALMSYKSAYQIAMFADNLFQVVDDIEKNKESISYISTNTSSNPQKIVNWDVYKSLAFILILVIIILLILLILFYNKVRFKNSFEQYIAFLEYRIGKLKTFMFELEQQHRQKKISDKNYKIFFNNYINEINFLEKEKKTLEAKVSEIKELEKQVEKRQRTIEELKEDYIKNRITNKDYISHLKEYDSELKTIKRNIDFDMKTISETIIDKKQNKETKKRKYSYKPIKRKKKGLKSQKNK